MSDVFWAAFGGGAAAGIFTLLAVIITQWIRWTLERPLIKVGVSFARFNSSTYLFSDKKLYIGLEARNPHDKTVTLSTFGYLFRSKADGKLQVLPDGLYQFPYPLEAGKAITQSSEEENLFIALKKMGMKPKDLKCAYFTSSAGATYSGEIPPITMKKLNEHYKEYLKQ